MNRTNDITTTKTFMSGRSQAIRIPKEYRYADDNQEVYINKVGDTLMITPVNSLKETFLKSLTMFTDDFLEDGRPEELPNERIEL